MCANPATNTYAPCPICHSTQQCQLLRHKKDRFIKKIACNDITFVLCKYCGFTFQNPQPDHLSLNAFYKQGEFELETSEKYFKSSKLDAQKKTVWLQKNLNKNRNGRVLEIGSSAGFLLHALRDEGWDVCGVEPSTPLSCYAKETLGLDIRTGFFEETTLPDKTFDLIIALHVIEHSTNPVEFLNIVRSKLSEDGVLFIEVPNIFSMRADRSIFDYFCSIHMAMFTPITISNLLSKTGFQTMVCEITDRGISVLAKPGGQKEMKKESVRKIKTALLRHRLKHLVYTLKKIPSGIVKSSLHLARVIRM